MSEQPPSSQPLPRHEARLYAVPMRDYGLVRSRWSDWTAALQKRHKGISTMMEVSRLESRLEKAKQEHPHGSVDGLDAPLHVLAAGVG